VQELTQTLKRLTLVALVCAVAVSGFAQQPAGAGQSGAQAAGAQGQAGGKEK